MLNDCKEFHDESPALHIDVPTSICRIKLTWKDTVISKIEKQIASRGEQDLNIYMNSVWYLLDGIVNIQTCLGLWSSASYERNTG